MWLQQESKARVVMQCVTLGAGALSMLGLTGALLVLIHTTNATVKAVPVQIAALRTATVGELRGLRLDLNEQLDATRTALLGTVNHQVNGLRGDLRVELDAYRGTADARIGQTLDRVDAALADVQALRTAAVPVLNNAAAITGTAQDAAAVLLRRDALPAQLLGLTAAAKVALGETAQTMRTVQRATPEIAANIKKATEESAKASENTAALTKHLAEETKPLPKWVRIGLGVAPPLAQTGAAVTTVLSVLGLIP